MEPKKRFRKRTKRPQSLSSRGTPTPATAQRHLLEMQTLQDLRTVFGSARRHDTEIRGLAGMPGSQLWALSEIVSSKGMSVNDLSERMALHQTTASNLVNALTERGLIARTRDSGDQRIVRLNATLEGKRALLRAPAPYAGLLVDALQRLGNADLRKLKQALSILIDVMRKQAPDSAGETLLGE